MKDDSREKMGTMSCAGVQKALQDGHDGLLDSHYQIQISVSLSAVLDM